MAKPCESCKKNIATWHVTYPGSDREMDLCDECAREQGLINFDSQFSLADLIGSLLAQTAKREQTKLAKLRCPVCGLSYADFRAAGRLGCANDYSVFAKALMPLLEKIHGAVEHVGKAPAALAGELAERGEVYSLRRELRQAVESENYEEAARLRDRIHSLEEKLDED